MMLLLCRYVANNNCKFPAIIKTSYRTVYYIIMFIYFILGYPVPTEPKIYI